MLRNAWYRRQHPGHPEIPGELFLDRLDTEPNPPELPRPSMFCAGQPDGLQLRERARCRLILCEQAVQRVHAGQSETAFMASRHAGSRGRSNDRRYPPATQAQFSAGSRPPRSCLNRRVLICCE